VSWTCEKEKMMKRMSRAVLSVICVLTMAAAAAAREDDRVAADPAAISEGVAAAPPRTLAEIVAEARDPEWGTGALAAVNLAAWGFGEGVQGPLLGSEPTLFAWNPTGGTNAAFGIYRFGGTASAGGVHTWFGHALDLPSGAQIMGMTLEGCDTNAAQQVILRLATLPSGGTFSVAPEVSTGAAATPGCALFGSPTNLQASNIFVDKLANTYLVYVSLGAADTSTSFRSVRVFYRLRVSPAPATATFPNDVPTSHPFFRFGEAMAASGVTGGCGAGSFCPDQAVTRGQMAVFLATALGLHFPN
jgi:S-layer family protein